VVAVDKAVISAGEIAPKFGHESDLVAYSDTLGKLRIPDGFARVAEPAGAALLVAGIAGIILVRRSAVSAWAPVPGQRLPASMIPEEDQR
jgi:hypothetical protein